MIAEVLQATHVTLSTKTQTLRPREGVSADEATDGFTTGVEDLEVLEGGMQAREEEVGHWEPHVSEGQI